MAKIELRHITKEFNGVEVIKDLNLVIPDGKFTVLVGPSGCGKTTLLRVIAGIGPATSGQVVMDGKDITDLEPGKRDVAMVFQNYAIYPTMSVRDNIEFGLKNRKVPKDERDRRINAVTKMVGLSDMLDRKPSTLSGGQRQRIALARAMVKNPKVFLMDEPLSNLDAKLRNSMRSELIEMHRKLAATFVYVTHDQVEAMAMADMIVLINKGKIVQQGTPRQLYNDPDNVFAAQFLGTPPMNILPCDEGVLVGFRPEKIILSEKPSKEYSFCRRAELITCEMLGSEYVCKAKCGDQYVMIKSTKEELEPGQYYYLCLPDSYLLFFDEKGKRIRPDEQRHSKLLRKVADNNGDL